jgi:membrane protein DedA with SNARE-associated domain
MLLGTGEDNVLAGVFDSILVWFLCYLGVGLGDLCNYFLF